MLKMFFAGARMKKSRFRLLVFFNHFFGKIFNEFCVDFSRILAPKSLPKRFRKHVEKNTFV